MNYRELPVYRKARKLVIGVDRLLTYFPNTPQAWIVSKQLFDAATSIGANIAEGRGRHMGKEYERFLYYAQGSANEVDHWLHTAKDCHLAPAEHIDYLLALNKEILKLLATTLSTLRAKRLATAQVAETGVEYITEITTNAPDRDIPFPVNPYPLTLNPCPLFPTMWES